MAKLNMAGHEFDLGVIGPVRCIRASCRFEGGALYTDVLTMQESEINKPGLAHYGNTSPSEYKEVVAERERISGTFKS